MDGKICVIEGCGKLARFYSKYCASHLSMMGKKNAIVKIPRQLPEENFWDKVDIKGEDDCWWWKGTKDAGGHGRGAYRVNGKLVGYQAHRFSYKLTYGEIPEGLLICHRCNNPACVNPKHLYAGTKSDNAYDAIKIGRWPKVSLKGEANPKSKLTESDVLAIRHLRKTTKLTYKEIGKLFGVYYQTIQEIIKGRSWTHI